MGIRQRMYLAASTSRPTKDVVRLLGPTSRKVGICFILFYYQLHFYSLWGTIKNSLCIMYHVCTLKSIQRHVLAKRVLT